MISTPDDDPMIAKNCCGATKCGGIHHVAGNDLFGKLEAITERGSQIL
jgi:hypothetical protein